MMNNHVPLFYPGVFVKTLAGVSSAALIGCAVAYRVYGELAMRDIIGMSISGLLFANLLHLWISLGRARHSGC
jgi:hypothetical protein